MINRKSRKVYLNVYEKNFHLIYKTLCNIKLRFNRRSNDLAISI